jgi:hypothetical protein
MCTCVQQSACNRSCWHCNSRKHLAAIQPNNVLLSTAGRESHSHTTRGCSQIGMVHSTVANQCKQGPGVSLCCSQSVHGFYSYNSDTLGPASCASLTAACCTAGCSCAAGGEACWAALAGQLVAASIVGASSTLGGRHWWTSIIAIASLSDCRRNSSSSSSTKGARSECA